MKLNTKRTRREFLKIVAAASAGFALADSVAGESPGDQNSKEMLVYVGTYTSGKSRSEGIYIYKLNRESGALIYYKTVKNVVEPSYLAIGKSREYLFAVNETVEFAGKKSGAISAFAIDQKNGDLKFINQQPSLGGAPCYVSISNDEKFVLVANYVGGNAAVFPIEKGGRLGAAVDVRQHTGAGANKQRQEAAHAHSIMLDKRNKFAFVNDLGIDRVMIYRFDDESGKLTANPAQAFFQAKPGAGPRHFAFHPHNKLAFVVNELDSTVSMLDYDQEQGALKEIQTISTIPADFAGANTCADIHVAPHGKFVYVSNRGHDSIAAFRVDHENKRLESIAHASTNGKTPRNFAIDPNGRFLLAANQNSDSIVVFNIDEETGRLAAPKSVAQAPSPVCLKIIPSFA